MNHQQAASSHTPSTDLVLFTVTANLSIVSLNMSLMLNPVAFYQVLACLILALVSQPL